MEDSIIVGDLHGHAWNSCLEENQRSAELASQSETSKLVVINGELPTRMISTNRSSSDISLANGSSAMNANCSCSAALSSDYLPNVIELECDVTTAKLIINKLT